MKRFEITQEQILEMASWGARQDIQKVKRWFPEAFETKVEVGKWYKNPVFGQALYFVTEIENDNIIAYGFDYEGKWHSDSKFGEINGVVKTNEATPQEVENALVREAKKRGYDKGCTNLQASFQYGDERNYMYFNGEKIFNNGKWATIIETITKEEAEKLLNKKIV